MLNTINKNHSLQDATLAPLFEKYAACISLIIPLHKPTTEKKQNSLALQKAVDTVKNYVLHNYEKQLAKSLLSSVDALLGTMKIDIDASGIGLFVSPEIKQYVPFYFPVQEKIIISDSFEIRDLIYQSYYLSSYFVVHLTRKEVKLFKGKLGTLTEVKDEKFPYKHENNYEYNRSTRGSSYVGAAFLKDYEQDKSQLEKIRFEHFVKTVDKTLNSYLNYKTKIILAGVESDISCFKKHTHHNAYIAGQVNGNYIRKPLQDLAASAWNVIKTFSDQQKTELVGRFWEEIGKGQAVIGLPNIWKAVQEGRAYQLLVEKDFMQPGFLVDGDSMRLHLKPPIEPHRVLVDAIDDLIQTVLDKDGEVVMVENGVLAPYQHVALITRY